MECLTTTRDTFGSNQEVSHKTSSKKAGWAVELLLFSNLSSGNMLNVKPFNVNNSG